MNEGKATAENREKMTREVKIEAVDPSPDGTGEGAIQPRPGRRGERNPREGRGPLGPARTRTAEAGTSAPEGAQEALDMLAVW